MLAALRRPTLTRTLATGILMATAVALPGAAAEPASAAALPAYRVLTGTVLHPRPAVFVLPVREYRLTGRFGDRSGLWSTRHTGLDFAAPTGTPIRAVAAGVVVSTGFDGRYGTRTVVRLAGGADVWYCHQDSVAVARGDRVGVGEVIGAVGSTGNVTGPHLHLEVHPAGGDPVDPLTWLRRQGLRP